MQKEVSSSQEYEFEFRGGINNSYFFETDKEIFYEVRFTPTDYLFDNKLFDQYTYEFSIIVSDNPTHKTQHLMYELLIQLPLFLEISMKKMINI